MGARDGFVFYRSFYEAINELDIETQWEIYKAIVEYGLDGKLPEIDGVAKAIFLMAKPQMEANYKRYKNGTKGGAPKGNQNARKTTENNQETTKKQPENNLKQPKEKDKEKDKEKEKDKDKDKDKVNNKPADCNADNNYVPFVSDKADPETVAAINELRRRRAMRIGI